MVRSFSSVRQDTLLSRCAVSSKFFIRLAASTGFEPIALGRCYRLDVQVHRNPGRAMTQSFLHDLHVFTIRGCRCAGTCACLVIPSRLAAGWMWYCITLDKHRPQVGCTRRFDQACRSSAIKGSIGIGRCDAFRWKLHKRTKSILPRQRRRFLIKSHNGGASSASCGIQYESSRRTLAKNGVDPCRMLRRSCWLSSSTSLCGNPWNR